MTPTAAAAGRTRLGALVGSAWRVRSRPLAALTAPVRVPLAMAAAPLGRGAGPLAAPPAALRDGGQDVTPTELVARLERCGTLSGRLVVLVPPDGADERIWERGRTATGATYAERLHHLLGWTPVHVRLAPGTPGDAGLELAALLQRLVEAWPVPVQRVVLVAAGSGGLAVRAACAVRLAGDPAWTERLTEVVGLGVPRYGSAPGRLATDLGRRLDRDLAGIVSLDHAALALEPVSAVEHLLVSEQAVLGPGPLGTTLGRVLWWRHRRGAGPRSVVDLFPGAEGLVMSADGPLTNRGDVHDALLRLLA